MQRLPIKSELPLIASVNLVTWNRRQLSLGRTEEFDLVGAKGGYSLTPIEYEADELRLKLPETIFVGGFRTHEFNNNPHAFLPVDDFSLLEVYQDIENVCHDYFPGYTFKGLLKESKNGKKYLPCVLNDRKVNVDVTDVNTGNQLDKSMLMDKTFRAVPTLRFIAICIANICYVRAQVAALNVSEYQK